MTIRTVLIVDDNENIRIALRGFFDRQKEWKVVGEAEDGSMAIQKALELKPDLIVMDVRMPGMNGIEAALVAKKRLPNTRVVVFTLFDESIGRRLTSTVGIDLVVSKSEGSNGLIQGIRRLARESGRALRFQESC